MELQHLMVRAFVDHISLSGTVIDVHENYRRRLAWQILAHRDVPSVGRECRLIMLVRLKESRDCPVQWVSARCPGRGCSQSPGEEEKRHKGAIGHENRHWTSESGGSRQPDKWRTRRVSDTTKG